MEIENEQVELIAKLVSEKLKQLVEFQGNSNDDYTCRNEYRSPVRTGFRGQTETLCRAGYGYRHRERHWACCPHFQKSCQGYAQSSF